MQLGAAMSGLAIENSMLGAAHATANPLTARFDLTHGHAVALMLPHVIRFNKQDAAANSTYGVLEKLIPEGSGFLDMADWVDHLVTKAGLADLVSFGIKEDNLAELAQDASQQWTGKFNPITVAQDDFISLYANALERMAKSA